MKETTPVKLTVFDDLTGKKARSVDWDPQTMVMAPKEYKKKQAMPLLRFGRFGDLTTPKGSLRHDKNLLEATGLELDYDSGARSYEDARDRMIAAGVAGYIYTSPSHTEEKPRWRILCPFSQAVTQDISIHRLACVKLCEDILGVEFNSDTTKITQSYFFGRVVGKNYQADEIPGEPIDMNLDLPFFMEIARSERAEAMDQEQKIRDLETGENITESAMSLIGKQVQAGMSREFIITTMTAMIEKAEGRSSAVLQQRIRDLPRQVDNIIALHKRNNPDAEPERPETSEGLQFQKWDEITESKVEIQLVEEVLTVNASSMMIAGYNVGKSALLLDLMVHVSAGEDWCGRRVEQRPCIYMAAEGSGSIRNRILAYRDDYPNIPLYVLPAGGWTLSDAKGRQYVEKQIIEFCRSQGIEQLGIIGLDTLAEAAPGIDENSATMGEIISWSKALATKVHGHVVTVHHQAKHSTGSRGHTSAPAAADTLFELSTQGDIITAKLTKQRDLGTKGEGVQFRINGYDTGQVSNFGNRVRVARVEYLSDFGPIVDLEEGAAATPAGLLKTAVLNKLAQGPYVGTWPGLCEDAWSHEDPLPSRPTQNRVRRELGDSSQMFEAGTGYKITFTRPNVDLDKL